MHGLPAPWNQVTGPRVAKAAGSRGGDRHHVSRTVGGLGVNPSPARAGSPSRGRPAGFVLSAGILAVLTPPRRRSTRREEPRPVAGVGVDVQHAGATNSGGIAETTSLLREVESGLIFVNLVETDQVYGHRHDVEGFHRALIEIDAAVAEWLGGAPRRRPVDPDCRPRCRPNRASRRSHARISATAGDVHGKCGPASRRPARRRGASVLSWITGRRASELPGEPLV